MRVLIKQLLGTVVFLGFFIAPFFAVAQENAMAGKENSICVENSSGENHVFAVEAGENNRITKELSDGEKLCIKSDSSVSNGVVSVYEEIDAMEGCSRIVPIGTLEKMFKFADADRCLWSSNS